MSIKQEKLNYYENFLNNAKISVEISNILKNLAEKYNANSIDEVVKEVHKLENDADKNLHNMLNYLIKDFLPPIEREDIILLGNRIDDMIDYLDEIIIKLEILNIETLREEFKDFVEIINRQSNSLIKMLEFFKNPKQYKEVHQLVIDINCTEDEGDRLFEKSIRNLFINEKNPIEVIKWNTIYNGLENCIDSYENIASTVDEIILKSS